MDSNGHLKPNFCKVVKLAKDPLGFTRLSVLRTFVVSFVFDVPVSSTLNVMFSLCNALPKAYSESPNLLKNLAWHIVWDPSIYNNQTHRLRMQQFAG